MFRNACALLVSSSVVLCAQNYRISTVAGTGTFRGDGGAATTALVAPGALAVDQAGNVYLSDPINHRIRKVDPNAIITSVIGKGYDTFSGDGGPAIAAGMSTASALAVDASGNLYFTDDQNFRIREITPNGMVKTIAGTGVCGKTAAGVLAGSAPLCDIESVGVDPQGRVFFGSGSQVWKILSDGTLALVAGTGGTGNKGDGGAAAAAEIGYPSSLAIDEAGNVYLADTYDEVIREVTTDGRINTVATITDTSASTVVVAIDSTGALAYATGRSKIFRLSQGITSTLATLPGTYTASNLAITSSGAIYASSPNSERLLKVVGDSTSVIAGAYAYGLDPLPAPERNVRLLLEALYSGLAVDANGNVYFVELGKDLNNRIDKLTPDGTLSAVNTPATLANKIPFTAAALAVGPGGLLYFSTFTQVYRLETDGSATLIAGGPGFPSALGDGGPATAAKVTTPTGLAFDSAGNLYFAEPFDNRVRKVSPQNIITTFAGNNGNRGYSGDGGQALFAELSAPVDVKIDKNDNVYIADLVNHVVRKVNSGGVISTVAGTGHYGFSGDGGLATKAELSGAAAIALDQAGNLFIADRPSAAATFVPIPDNNRIRLVNAAGIITTIAGGKLGYNGENVVAQLAATESPVALATDAQGNLFVTEPGSERVRKLTPAPKVVIQSVNTAGGYPDIAQNDFIEIVGANLAPASVGAGLVWSNAPEFAQGRMPTQLANVSVTVNGKPAFVYFVSPGQLNVLTPLDNTTGTVAIVVNNNGVFSEPFLVKMGSAAPSLLRFGATSYAVATHADYKLLGPATLSVPGFPFTPAKPAEYIVLYGVGFGLPSSALTNGSSTQSGTLPVKPVIKIGGVPANVLFAGINGSPGLYQFNVVVPPGAANDDVQVLVDYGSVESLPSGITVHQ
jgi:uncharacterized protein (TIGR03437 family)